MVTPPRAVSHLIVITLRAPSEYQSQRPFAPLDGASTTNAHRDRTLKNIRFPVSEPLPGGINELRLPVPRNGGSTVRCFWRGTKLGKRVQTQGAASGLPPLEFSGLPSCTFECKKLVLVEFGRLRRKWDRKLSHGHTAEKSNLWIGPFADSLCMLGVARRGNLDPNPTARSDNGNCLEQPRCSIQGRIVPCARVKTNFLWFLFH
jgi:hypothetical protein